MNEETQLMNGKRLNRREWTSAETPSSDHQSVLQFLRLQAQRLARARTRIAEVRS